MTERVRLVLGWAKEALAERELAEKISHEVRDGLDQQQREHILRRQMDAIRKELGDEDDGETADDYRERIDALEAGGVADEVVRALRKELGRFERMPEQNMERGWIQGWLDTVLGLPWTERTTDELDVDVARATLDADHTGLDEVKERIVELLAVRKLRQERGIEEIGTARRKPGAILALVGPPGVGKTSLGESVARALGSPVRARRPRRRARRGRDPRPPPHLRRRPARAHRPGHDRGRHDEPRRAARRGRQGRQRLARRPVGGPARGARPGAEPHVPRPLPGGRPRPLRRAVHRDRQRARDDPRAAARPPRADPRRRLHRGREGRHRPRPPARAAGAQQRPRGRRGGRHRRRPARHRRRLHAGGRRARARAAARQGAPQGRRARRRRRRDAGHRRRRATCTSCSVASGSTPRRSPSAPPSRAWPPASPSPGPAETCSSSRPPRWTASRACRSPASSAT